MPAKGQHLTPEQQQRYSDAAKLRYQDPHQRALTSERNKTGGRWATAAQHEAARQGGKARMSDPAMVEQIFSKQRGQVRPATIAAWARHRENHDDSTCTMIACHPRFHSQPEEFLLELLAEFPEVVREQRFGRYRVDAYVPSRHLAFEADGDYWHSSLERKAYDQARDRSLLSEFDLVVIRLTETELRRIHGEIREFNAEQVMVTA